MVKILYLEDEKAIQEVTHEYLKTLNYDIDIANDGLEAFSYLEKNTYDLAILDIIVPYHSGLEVLEKVTQTSPNTKTIMLTALGSESSQIDAFDRFADDYIIKPFSPTLLLKRVEAILRRSNTGTTQQGLNVLSESFQVYYDGQSLNFTVSEFLIFNAMYSSPKKVFSRSELLDILDPDNLSVNDRVIDAHIKNIRKKSPKVLIKTIIGIGYQYENI